MKYIIFLMILVSCASAKKEAIKLTEQGKNEEALTKWVEAFKDNPKDEEVVEGLRQCQETILNDRLVKVRDLRLARNDEDALKKLKSVVEFQKSYSIKLDINSSTFQGKETIALWPYQRSKISELMNQKRPLGAEYRLKTYDDVFHSMNESKTLAEGIKKLGSLQCRSLEKAPRENVFYQSFAGQFCQHFDPEHANVKTNLGKSLYHGSTFVTDIKSTSPEMKAVFEDKLSQKFAESPWFHGEAKSLAATSLSGEFSHSRAQKEIEQAHNYSEKVPYTDYKTVTRTRSVPYTAYDNRCSFNAQLGRQDCQNVAQTRYRDERYQEQEAVTKYRDVQRTFRYFATKNTQEFSLVLRGGVSIKKLNVPVAFTKIDKEDWIVHDQNLPNIGLYPAKDTGSSPVNKFSEYAGMVSDSYLADLNLAWKNEFCVLPKSRDQYSVGESVIKCKRMKEYPKDFVDSWFKDNFSVTADEAVELVGNF